MGRDKNGVANTNKVTVKKEWLRNGDSVQEIGCCKLGEPEGQGL